MNIRKKIIYTIVLDYKNKTYVYQVLAQNETKAKIKWLNEIDLDQIQAPNSNNIKKELIFETINECFYPTLLNGLQCVWSACIINFSEDDENYATANIIATVTNNQNNKNNNNFILHKFSKNQILYTIQLDYKGGTYVSQVLANDIIDAKIKWIKQLDFSVMTGAPSNVQETKDKILQDTQKQNFSPKELHNMESVWTDTIQLGDAIGRVTIVITLSE